MVVKRKVVSDEYDFDYTSKRTTGDLTEEEEEAIKEALREDKWLTTDEMWSLMGWQKK